MIVFISHPLDKTKLNDCFYFWPIGQDVLKWLIPVFDLKKM